MTPITFIPIYQPRVWGGRTLENVYGRQLPSDAPYGESWELSDREEAQSTVISTNYHGQSLHSLWKEQRDHIFGNYTEERFPLLIKILDTKANLSIQVHPPQHLAVPLNGEPKTEMWYIAHAEPGATIYVGLKKGTTKATFEEALKNGDPEKLVHAIQPKAGESINIPSGRLHAIGAGLVIYEIQQNSDTTFRVFDWNRLGLDGKPRDLHIEESMMCIDFDDFEPEMDTPNGSTLAECPYYKVDQFPLKTNETITNPDPESFSIITVVEGSLVDCEGTSYTAGDFLLLPRGAAALTATTSTKVLQTTLPS